MLIGSKAPPHLADLVAGVFYRTAFFEPARGLAFLFSFDAIKIAELVDDGAAVYDCA